LQLALQRVVFCTSTNGTNLNHVNFTHHSLFSLVLSDMLAHFGLSKGKVM